MIGTRLMLLSAALLATGAEAQPADPPAAALAIAGPVLMVKDLEASLKFYTEGLGLNVAMRLPPAPAPGATVTAAAGSSSPFLLLLQTGATPAGGKPIQVGDGLSRIMLLAPDSAAVAARLDKAGYSHAPVSDHHVFFVTDPDGYRLEIMQQNSRH